MDKTAGPDDLSLEGAARSIVSAASRLLSAPVVALIFIRDDGNASVPAMTGLTQPIDHGAALALVHASRSSSEVVRIDNVRDERDALSHVARLLGLGSLLLAPVRTDAPDAGVLLAGGWEPHAFTDGQLEIAGVLADQAATQLMSIRFLAMERADRRRAQALLEVAQAVTQSSDLDTALTRICRAAATFSVAHRCSIFLGDGSGRPRPVAGWDAIGGPQADRLEYFRAFQGRLLWEDRAPSMDEIAAFLGGLPLVWSDASLGPRAVQPWVKEFGVRSLASYPLMTRHGMVGLMNLTAHHEAVHFPADEIEAMNAIALQAAAVIEHLNLLERVRQQAVRDGLTGLHNRRYLMESLERELLIAEQDGEPLAVALLDVDGMKRLNDSHGHSAGDALLQRVAAALTATFRATDTIARYGGDEFIVLMPGTELDAAIAHGKRLQSMLTAEEPPASVSMGIAVAPVDAQTATGLLDAADRAMYEAKRSGYGGIVVARDRRIAAN